MKALTICQPYAELIARGEKFVENRTWETFYRGPLAIHAGKSREWLGLNDDETADETYSVPLSDMSFGAVVAIATLTACLHISRIRGSIEAKKVHWSLHCHEHTEGPFCWVLENVVRLPEPIPARGAQGLWEWQEPDELRSTLKGSVSA